jgi:hypothetical protein
VFAPQQVIGEIAAAQNVESHPDQGHELFKHRFGPIRLRD